MKQQLSASLVAATVLHIAVCLQVHHVTSPMSEEDKWTEILHGSASSLSVAAVKSDPAASCPFSAGRPSFPPWENPEAQISYSVLQELFEANAGVVLKAGTLLGAYRHHGAIPFDMDVDLIFEICDPKITDTTTPKITDMSCKQIAQERARMGKIAFNQKVYDERFAPKLKNTKIKLVTVTSYGLRLTNGPRTWDGGLYSHQGIGIDIHFNLPDHTALAVCKCSFGPTFSLCPLDAKNMLTKAYGKDFMIPKSQCEHYADTGHADWNRRSGTECLWAKNIKPVKK